MSSGKAANIFEDEVEVRAALEQAEELRRVLEELQKRMRVAGTPEGSPPRRGRWRF